MLLGTVTRGSLGDASGERDGKDVRLFSEVLAIRAGDGTFFDLSRTVSERLLLVEMDEL